MSRAAPIAYAQCWEDADILLEGLDVRPGARCLSIASGGDNTLALLARSPERVVAIDSNRSQIACLELRVAAFRSLEHREMLELVGSVPSGRRHALYLRCRRSLSADARAFWDARRDAIEGGIAGCGRLERYLATFRNRVLPAIHPRPRVDRLLAGGSAAERERFYAREWDTWRWRAAFRIFFSRFVMALSGRRREYFRHARGSISEHLLGRTRHACTFLDPAENPYLQWILAGTHRAALPFALRAASFDAIRANLDRLEWRCTSLDAYLAGEGRDERFDRCNLSDVFEYLGEEDSARLLEALLGASAPRARFAYWNLLVPRRRPECLAGSLRPLAEVSARLHAADKAFFYGDFVLEEAQ
jgi:S-adenosylmethionine-diacylglycerol 3-amino-3-carboxypropyl transferase